MNKSILWFLSSLFYIASANAIQLEESIVESFVNEDAEVIEPYGALLTKAHLKSALDDANNTACVKPTDLAGLTDGWEVFNYSLKANAAIKLEFWGKHEIKVDDTVYIFNMAFYKACRDENGYVKKRYGSGIQLNLRATTHGVDASFSGLPAIAASTELNQAEVHYKLKTFGISGPKVIAAMPELSGEYDIEMHVKLFNAIAAIRVAALDPSTTFTPDVLVTITSKEIADQQYVEAMAMVWALSSIKNGISSKESKKRSPADSAIAKNEIDRTYMSIMKSEYGKKTDPSEIHKLMAKQLLAIYKYDIKTE